MTATGLVDSHLHLQDYEPGIDIGRIINESINAGVTHLVCNGTDENDWIEVERFSNRYEQVIPCYGLHPWFVKSASCEWADKLEELIAGSGANIGETGLDRLHQPFEKESQEAAFRKQIDIGYRYNRAVMIHCVHSWGWLIDILKDTPNLPSAMLFHSYAGSVDMINQLIDYNAYFTFSGKVLFNNFKKAQAALKQVPLDRILIESDSPNMIPPDEYCAYEVLFSDGYRGNHPGNIMNILNGISKLINIPAERLKEIVWENSARFFNLTNV